MAAMVAASGEEAVSAADHSNNKLNHYSKLGSAFAKGKNVLGGTSNADSSSNVCRNDEIPAAPSSKPPPPAGPAPGHAAPLPTSNASLIVDISSGSTDGSEHSHSDNGGSNVVSPPLDALLSPTQSASKSSATNSGKFSLSSVKPRSAGANANNATSVSSPAPQNVNVEHFKKLLEVSAACPLLLDD
jgi:hypothetical protein